MPRLTHAVPKYRKHTDGHQAFVEFHGKRFYLGPYGTKASKIEYDRRITEWLANGRNLTETTDQTVVELLAEYWKFAKQHYRKNGSLTIFGMRSDR